MRNSYLLTSFATLATLVSSCTTIHKTEQIPKEKPIVEIYNQESNGKHYKIQLEVDLETAKQIYLYGINSFSKDLESYIKESLENTTQPPIKTILLRMLRDSYLLNRQKIILEQGKQQPKKQPPKQKHYIPLDPGLKLKLASS